MNKPQPNPKKFETASGSAKRRKGNPKGKSRRSFFPAYLEDFCHLLHEGYSQREAGMTVGLAASAGRKLAQRPDVQQRLAEIEKEYGERIGEERAKAQVLREEFIDLQVMDMAVNGEGKGKHGRLSACRLAYQKLQLIDPPNAQTLLALSMTQQGGGGFVPPKLYEAQRFVKLQQQGQYMSDNLTLSLPAGPGKNGGADGC